MSKPSFNRIALVVLDSVGIGEMPDAATWGDEGSDTLGHVCEFRPLRLPNLVSLGLANIRPFAHQTASEAPLGAYGRCALASNGKDTITGHWEMAGLYMEKAFPTYPDGFPSEVMEPFEKAIGRGTLGNVAASGTEIIKQLGEEHVRTGKPIVYTSADSVFQIAAHERVIPIDELYGMCEAARELLQPPHQVGRVIARPFVGESPDGAAGQEPFSRTTRRKDYAIVPPEPLLMAKLQEQGVFTHAVGKIKDIFCGQGVADAVKTKSNAEGIEKTLTALEKVPHGFIFTNLVDFDMLFGHRNDVEGYALALEQADVGIGDVMKKLGKRDLLVLTADHGCDPSTASTDHSREYVPLLAYSPGLTGGVDLGSRSTLADIGQTIAANFGTELTTGVSFLESLR